MEQMQNCANRLKTSKAELPTEITAVRWRPGGGTLKNPKKGKNAAGTKA